MRTSDRQLIQEAIDIIKATGSLEYSLQVAKDIIAKAWTNIEPLLPEGPAKPKLKVFADYLVSRSV